MADSTENRDTYESLRDDGVIKSRAAAISNAQANDNAARGSSGLRPWV